MNNLISTIFFISASIIKSLQDNCEHFPDVEKQCICASYSEDCGSPSPIVWNYNIVKTYEGEVDVILQNVKLCDNNENKVRLLINEEITDINECNENTKFTSPLLQKHSEITLEKCLNCTKISDNITIKFNYVFTGCYTVTIVENNSFPTTRSVSKFISTNFPKELNGTAFELLFNPIPTRNETKIEIIFNSINMTKRSIKTSVIKKECKQNCSLLNSITKVTFENSLVSKENFTRCVQDESIKWNCSYSRNSQHCLSYSCFYYDLKPSSYIFNMALIDEYTRCNEDSIWATEHLCKEQREFNVSLSTPENSYAIERHESQTMMIVLSSTCLILLLLILMIYYIHKKIWTNKYRSRVLPNKIFIVYARDAPLFSEMIEQLKNILLSINETVVYDIMDEKLLFINREYIISDIMAKNTHAKIILFLNKCSIILKKTNYSTEYIRPQCQDYLFKYAIQQLERRTSENLENFVIIGAEKQDLYEFKNLNAKRRYLMPDKILKLLKRVFDGNTKFQTQLLTNFENKCREYKNLNADEPQYYKNILFQKTQPIYTSSGTVLLV